jgi:hypothetical protein
LSKGRSSTFLFHVYPRAITEQAQMQIQALMAVRDLKGESADSEPRVGDRITVGLQCPMIEFSPEQVTLRIEDRLNKASFVGIPVESCAPGEHDALATIVDAQTKDAHESVEFTIKVVDYAFDHVSTPLMSKASSAFFGIVSAGSFVLTSLKEIDVALGLTAGTAAATLTAVILGWGYLPFYVPKTVERVISV